MLLIKVNQLRNIIHFIDKTYPKEAAGIIIGKKLNKDIILSFIETSTEENTWFTFRIRDDEIRRIENSIKDLNKKIYGCFHSHNFGTPTPSRLDCDAKKKKGDLWLIYSVKFLNLRIYKWNGKSFQNESFRIIK